MPYASVRELPDYVKEKPSKEREQWMAVWNSVYDACIVDGREAAYCEGKAFRAANAVVAKESQAGQADAASDIVMEIGTTTSGNWMHRGDPPNRGGSAPGGGLGKVEASNQWYKGATKAGGAAVDWMVKDYRRERTEREKAEKIAKAERAETRQLSRGAKGYSPARHSGDDFSVYDEARQRLGGLDSEDDSRGHRQGDAVLSEILHEQGFDRLPEVVDDLQPYIDAGEVQLFRGVGSPEQAEQFRSGWLYAGRGIYGNGTYTSTKATTADAYHSDGPSAVFTMTLRKDAKVIDFDAAEDARRIWEELPASADREQAFFDTGRWAAAAGYDAIRCPRGGDEEYYVILNRTATRVERAPTSAEAEADVESGFDMILEVGSDSSGNFGHAGIEGHQGGSEGGSPKVAMSRHAFARMAERKKYQSVKQSLRDLERVETPPGDWHMSMKRKGKLDGYLVGTDGVVKTVLGPWYAPQKLPGPDLAAGLTQEALSFIDTDGILLLGEYGTASSGNYGHAGIPGHQGGSAPQDPGPFYKPAANFGAEPALGLAGLEDKSLDDFMSAFSPEQRKLEDVVLKEILHTQGFDGPPEVVDDLGPFIEDGETELWRGVGTAEQAEQFRSGELFVGKGCGGNGTYTSESQEMASGYGGPEALLHMTLRKDARIASQTDLDDARKSFVVKVNGSPSQEETTAYRANVREAMRNGDQKEVERLDSEYLRNALPRSKEMRKAFSDDQGRFAAALGYDAIRLTGGTMLILNRTAVRVAKA